LDRLKSLLGPLWNRWQPGREAVLEAELDDSRAEISSAGADADLVREELAAEWSRRLRRMLAADPAVASELRRLLDVLGPMLDEAVTHKSDIRMNAKASGSGRVYQAGRDMNITEQ
jgi:hypothetical protein